MKNVVKLLTVFVLMFFVFTYVSCKKKDTTPQTHQVVYKAQVMNGTISDVSYTNASNQQTSFTGLDSTSYASSPLAIPPSTVPVLTFTSHAVSVSGGPVSDSTAVPDSAWLTLQILVDGNIVKSDSTKAALGDSLTVTSTYNF